MIDKFKIEQSLLFNIYNSFIYIFLTLILFWSLSLLFLHRAIFQEKKTYWIFTGIVMGLAFNSKYTAILLQFGLIAFLNVPN